MPTARRMGGVCVRLPHSSRAQRGPSSDSVAPFALGTVEVWVWRGSFRPLCRLGGGLPDRPTRGDSTRRLDPGSSLKNRK